MWTIFALENLHFALNVFAALVFLSVAWLYYDAYRELRNSRDLWKVSGFIVLALAFIFRGVGLQGISPHDVSLYQSLFKSLDIYTRIAGYTMLIIGLLIDPLQPKPKLSAFVLATVPALFFMPPILSVVVAVLFLRRASIGLERHLFPPAISFFLISVYEILFATSLFRDSSNLSVFNLVAPFGIVWIAQIVLLGIGVGFIGRWVFRYLLKQFQSQLFMILMALVLAIYLIVTVGFTGLLINNLKNQILSELKSEANVLEFAFDAKKSELLSEAKLIASTGADNFDFSKMKHDMVVVFDGDGLVTFRAEDSERKGDSISGDILVKKVLTGAESSNVVVKDGVVAPTVMIVSGSPVVTDGKVTGGVLVGELIDSSYLEGFTRLTGLKAAVYGGDTLSAGDMVGVKESDKTVKETVLKKGETYATESKWLNRSFLSVYSPLRDVDGNPVGMFFVGRPQVEVLTLASSTLEIIFLGTVALLLASMIPATIISVSISKQIK